MALSDSIKRQKAVSGVRRVAADDGPTWWSDKQKLETVQTFMMFGNLAMTARILKIPENTVRQWRKSTWWQEIEGELRVQDELQLSARLKKIMENSLDAVEDRLEKGDYIFDQKTGQMKRKPVGLKDAHKVTMDLIDKRNIILNRTAPLASEEQMSDKLLKMMKQFADFAEGKLTENKTIDVVDVEIKEADAVHEDSKREEC